MVSSWPCTPTCSTPRTASTARQARSGSPSTRATITSLPIARFSAVGESSATMRPWSMIPTRSASSSASSRYCVVRKIVTPACAFSWRTSSHTRVRLTGSRPVVGSSRNSTSGLCTRAAARSRRRFMPPEYVAIRRSRASPSSMSPARSRTRRSASPRSSPNRRAWSRSSSRPLCWSSSAASCSATPMRSRTASGSVVTSWPATTARPAVGVSRVHSIRTVVVLPAPLGPRKP